MSDDNELSRRQLLAGAAGVAGGFVVAQAVREDSKQLPGGPLGGEDKEPFAEEGMLGDWPAIVTNDWDSVEVSHHPTLVYHLADGLQTFAEPDTYRTTVETLETTMDTIITENIADVSIDRYPTLVIELETDGGVGSQMIFNE